MCGFMIQTREGYVLYIWTKFEADSSIRSKVIRGSQNFELVSRDPDHAHLGVVLWDVRRRGTSSISVPNLKRIALYIKKVIRGSQYFEIWARDPVHATFMGNFDVPMQEWSVLHLFTKFEAHKSIYSSYKGSQIFEIGSRDPGHAHLSVVLWSARRRSSMSVPNLKRLALFVQKL